MKWFLDDVREPPNDTWTVFRTGEELWDAILQMGLEPIEAISFDNDLGTGRLEGYQVLDRIEELVERERPSRIPQLSVHSKNSVARQRMMIIIDRIEQMSLFEEGDH